jgi:uncharacterized protein YbjQ (UPF0145 family)
MRNTIAALVAVTMAGCANHATKVIVGTDFTYTSLKDQHEAASTVMEYKKIPDGATLIGDVLAARCHRYSYDAPPQESDVVIDLKVAAYAKGANGIAGVSIEKEFSLIKNCWTIYNGKATAFTLKK